jgi:hypothetical protein
MQKSFLHCLIFGLVKIVLKVIQTFECEGVITTHSSKYYVSSGVNLEPTVTFLTGKFQKISSEKTVFFLLDFSGRQVLASKTYETHVEHTFKLTMTYHAPTSALWF